MAGTGHRTGQSDFTMRGPTYGGIPVGESGSCAIGPISSESPVMPSCAWSLPIQNAIPLSCGTTPRMNGENYLTTHGNTLPLIILVATRSTRQAARARRMSCDREQRPGLERGKARTTRKSQYPLRENRSSL